MAMQNMQTLYEKKEELTSKIEKLTSLREEIEFAEDAGANDAIEGVNSFFGKKYVHLSTMKEAVDEELDILKEQLNKIEEAISFYENQ